MGSCLLTLILTAGLTGAIGSQDFPLPQSSDMIGGTFSQSFVSSLFGIEGGDSQLSDGWFGPQFLNNSSASSFFSQFYINASMPITGGLSPVKIDINQRLPAKIYFGSGKEITYTQYQSAISLARGNELWIQKYPDWSQYVIVPMGAGLQFIAFAPAGGQADYYEILESNVRNVSVKQISLFPGYNSLNFLADKVGRHILLFVQNNQPSNVVIVDVISQALPASSAVQVPPGSDMPPAYGQIGTTPGAYGQTTITSSSTSSATTIVGDTSAVSTSIQSSAPSYPTPAVPSGDTPVTIQSQRMRNYQVYVDGVLIGIEGSNGDAPDGKFSFYVVGNQEHDIRVYDGQFNYPRTIYFQRGVLKIINVEPGTAVYRGFL